MEPVLESGILNLKSDGKGGGRQGYVIRKLDETYMPQVMALQSVIVRNLKDRDMLEPFADDFMAKHFRKRGFVLGTFWGDVLVAFRNVYFPEKNDLQWNLGIDIGLAEAELDTVANLQMVCVHPDCRGNALALKMNLVALRLLRQMRGYQHICATVHPYNIFNVRILLHSGFSLRRIKQKYGGKTRYIAYQHLTNPVAFGHNRGIDIPLTDLGAQQVLMRQGYQGVMIKKRASTAINPVSAWYLTFKQPLLEPVVFMVPDKGRNSHNNGRWNLPVAESGNRNGAYKTAREIKGKNGGSVRQT